MIPLLAVLVSLESFAATLTVGQASAQPGDTAVTVPLSLALSPGDMVAALQADVQFEPDVLSLSSISAGPAATAADKTVSFSVQSPGLARLIIAGLNQNAVADGVVANMVFGVKEGAPAGAQAIGLTNTLAANPTGASVPVSAFPGGITVGITGGEGEEEGETASSSCCLGETASPHRQARAYAGDVLMFTLIALAALLAPRGNAPSQG
jgi:hypothetical protein